MKMYQLPFLSRALSIAIFSCLFATVSLNAAAPVITSSLAETYAVNVPIPTYTITASNGPTSFGAISLPPGLSRSGAVISGTPSKVGSFDVTLFVQNADGFDQETLELTVTGAEIESSLSETATVGQPYAYQIMANNGPNTFNVIGLDDFLGLSLDPSTGLISGTPTEPYSGDIIIQAINGASVATALLVLDVSGVPPAEPTVTIDSPLNGADYTDGDPITLEITADDADGFLTQVEVFSGTIFLGTAQFIGVDQYSFQANTGTDGLEVGTQNLTVQATDNVGNVVTSDSVVVDVLPKATGAAPDVSITSPTAGDSIKSGETLEITVDATDADIDGFITSVEVFNNDALLGLANPTGAAGKYLLSYRTSAADLGNLNLQARAIDNQGNVGYSAVIDYSVVQGAVPTVSIDSPDNGEVFLISTQIPLAITADDGDDSIVSVEVFSNGTSVGFASSAGGDQYQFTLTETGEAGLQRLTAVATDELDNSTTSEEVNILLSSGASPVTVLNTVNGSAPAVAPAVDEVDLGSIVTLGISASDSDGNVTQVEVFNGATSIGFANLVGVDTYRFDYQASSPGLLNLQVRASDDLGNIGFSDLVEVSVITGAIPTVTITSPTAGDSIKSGETLEITVDATDADIDGFITSVEVFNNDALLGLANPTGAAGKYLLSYRTSAADLGNLNLQARAIDNQGNVGYSAVIDYSVVQGAVPTVSIDSPDNGEVFLISTQIPLAITADDGDDSIVSVEVFSNGTSVGFASSAGGDQYQFTLTETGEAGLQRLTAVATDELDNSTTSEEVNILLSSGASPVTVLNTVNGSAPAVAPAVDEVDLGSIVTLGISASDSDGNVTQVEVFNGATSIGFANLVGVDTYRFDYQASSPGLLNLQVRASDDLGNIGFSDLVEVSVITGAIPTVTITSPTAGDSIKSGETLEITVDATDADIDGFITSVEVFNNDALLGLANPTGAAGKYLLSYRTSAADLGNLNLQARAIDNQGNVGYSAVIDYSVVQGAVPTVSIDSPDNGEVFLISTQIPLAITADDGDDSIVSVEVFSNGTSVGFASSAGGDQYQFTLTETGEAGLQRLTAVATDELDNSTTSEEVNILLSSGASPVTVLNTVNGSAPAVAPAVDEVDLGSIVTLGISASDSDGNVTQVEVFNGATSIGFANLVGVDTYRFDYQASSPGLLNLQVRASDDLGNIGFSDLVEVSVITGAIPTVTITSPTAGDSIKSGETLEITVDATDADIDGFITSVEVFNNDALLGLANPTGAAGKYLLSYRTSAADLGNLNLQARAIDNQGNVGYSAVIDYSVVQGAVPTVSIDSPDNGEVFLISTQIPLAITADDGDDSIVSVEVFSNGTSVGFASSAGGDQYQFTLTETGEAGLQRLTAVATDELDNSTTSEEVNILLSSGASPVTVLNTVNGSAPAVAPAVDEVDLGSIVTLGISASDSDGNVTQVEVFNGATSIGFANLVGVDTYRFDYQASSPGLLNLQVRASDDLGNIGFSDLVEVSVITGAIPTVTITSPTAGDSIKSGETLEITVDATDADIDGFITSVEVFNNDALLGLANPTGAAGKYLLSYRTSAADLGNLNLQARAIDNQGNVGYSAVIDYSVVQGAVPTVSIDSPDNGEVFLISTQIPLAITADDGDDSIVSVEVFSNGTSVGFASSAGGDQYQFTLTETGEAGLQRLTAVATDELDNSTTSEEVNILLSSGASPVTVLNTVNGSAPAVAPAVDEVDLGSIVTLGISASDSDGNVTQVEVFNGATSIGFANLVGVDTYRFDYQASSPGLLNLQVRASDDLGNIGFSDLVEVSVITGAIPTVTITSPTAGDSIKSGETLEITVDATDADIDGFITSVEVFNNDALLGLANPTGAAGKYLLSYRTSAADLGNLNLQARAIDNQGNVGYSAVIDYSVVQGAMPEVTFTSPVADASYTLGDLIALEITADDADGFVTQVEIFHDQASLGFALWLGGDQYRYTIDTATAGIAPGTLNLSARATDNSGNAAFALLAVDLVQFAYSVRFTDPTTDPFTLESDSFEVGTHLFEVEVVGIDPTTLQSVTWYLDGTELASSQIVSGNLIYSQSITLKANGVVTAVAANSTGVEVEASVTVALDLANPLSDDADFVNYAYFQLTATEPTAAYVSSAVSQMDGTIDGQVAYLEALFESDDMDETEMIMMVYRTMTGEWPNDEELQAARDGALGGTEGAASQSGNIEQGGTQTFEFFYNAGDIVTVRVAADASNGDPLTDATLTINDPSGGFVAYSDDSFLGLDPLVVFTATEAGSYSAIVGGFSTLQSGDFTITSTSSNSGESSDASAEALVQFLIPEFEDRFNMTFPTTSAVSGLEATNLVKQLFKNKHGGVPSGQPLIRLADALTGSGSAIIYGEAFPGYSGDLSSFTAAFALDNERHSWDGDYSRDNYYKIPNQPINDVPLALMIAMFLSEDPTDAALAEYNGMTQAEAFEDILTDPRYYEQFTPSSVSSYIVMRLAELGVFTQSLRGPDDDADGDGQSNLIEIALGSNPVDSSDTASNPRTNIEDGNDFVVTFIRIQASEVPGDFIIYAECSADMGSWDHREDTTDVALLAADQSGVPEGYERVEIRIDMTVRPCQFIRLSIDLP
jgi:hypothetical protein